MQYYNQCMKRQDFSILLSMNTYSMFYGASCSSKSEFEFTFSTFPFPDKRIIPLTWHAISICYVSRFIVFTPRRIFHLSIILILHVRFSDPNISSAANPRINLPFHHLTSQFSCIISLVFLLRMFQFQNLQLS